MADYGTDRKWSDKLIPQIKRIVGPFLLEPTPFEIDAKQAADLMVFRARDMHIAARVRRPKYLEKFPFDFTIRSQRDSGVETEYSKIVNGFADWMFYGHADEDDAICAWWLLDLHAFRAGLIRHETCEGVKLKFRSQDNRDGTQFIAFDVRSFPKFPPIVIGASHAHLMNEVA